MILKLYLTLIFSLIFCMGLFTYMGLKTKDNHEETKWTFMLNVTSMALLVTIAFGGLYVLWIV